MHKKYLFLIAILLILAGAFFVKNNFKTRSVEIIKPILEIKKEEVYPLAIEAMRNREYSGSDLKIEQTLANGTNYRQFIASYLSDGLKINGLLTVPAGEKPDEGWPVIVFNHGYIPPEQYRTTERYVAYLDGFAKNGYIVFKPDYRGNGSSEGEPEGAYYSPAYTVDVLNALSSLKKLRDPSTTSGRFVVDTNRIGMWGHSLGGNITLRSITVRPDDIKAAVIWGGVVGTYDDLMNNWTRRVPFQPSQREMTLRNRRRADIIAKYGTPKDNPGFWDALDPNFFLFDVKAPVQIHTGGSDEEVPPDFSQGLYNRLKEKGKTVEFYTYPGADHNLSGPAFNTAMQRSIEFFDKYLKQ